MTQNQPKKVGEYDRPVAHTSSSSALTIGIIAVLAIIVLAIFFLR